jgi:hypothetical protein
MIHPDIERVALLGWRVAPASRVSKASCIKGATDLATSDLNQIARWSTEFPNCNWRVYMSGSGIFALDCDVPPGHAHDGVAGLTALVQQNGPLPKRPTFRSGGGGVGLFFKHTNERIIGDGGHPAPGIDPRRGRQSQTIPPSIHISTRQPYRWIVPPWEVNPPEAPVWLLKLLEPKPEPAYRKVVIDTTDAARNRLYRAASAVMNAGSGERNSVLNAKSYSIGRMISAGLLGEQEAVDALYGAARTIGLEHAEAKATIRSGIMSGLKTPVSA